MKRRATRVVACWMDLGSRRKKIARLTAAPRLVDRRRRPEPVRFQRAGSEAFWRS